MPHLQMKGKEGRFLELRSSCSFVDSAYLDQGDPQGFLGHFAGDLIADSVDELVWNDKHQQVCVLHCLTEVWDSNLWQRGRRLTHVPKCAHSPSTHPFLRSIAVQHRTLQTDR